MPKFDWDAFSRLISREPELEEPNDGLSDYLLQNVINPLLEGRDIAIMDLNLEAFELDEVSDVQEYVRGLKPDTDILSFISNIKRIAPAFARPGCFSADKPAWKGAA